NEASAPSALAPDQGQDLVKDGDGRVRAVPVDGKGRVHAEVRAVDHADQPTPQALLEDPRADLAVERLARRAIAHQLDADQESLTAHVADHLVAGLLLAAPAQPPPAPDPPI